MVMTSADASTVMSRDGRGMRGNVVVPLDGSDELGFAEGKGCLGAGGVSGVATAGSVACSDSETDTAISESPSVLSLAGVDPSAS